MVPKKRKSAAKAKRPSREIKLTAESIYTKPASPEERAKFNREVDALKHVPSDIRHFLKARYHQKTESPRVDMNTISNIIKHMYPTKPRTKQLTNYRSLESYLASKNWRRRPITEKQRRLVDGVKQDLLRKKLITKTEVQQIEEIWAQDPEMGAIAAHDVLHYFVGKRFIENTIGRRRRARWQRISLQVGINLKKFRYKQAMDKITASHIAYLDKIGLAKFIVNKMSGKSKKWKQDQIDLHKTQFARESGLVPLFEKARINRSPPKIHFERDMKKVIFSELPLTEKLVLFQAIIYRKKRPREWEYWRQDWHGRLQSALIVQPLAHQAGINLQRLRFKRDMKKALASNIPVQEKSRLMNLMIELSRPRPQWRNLKSEWHVNLLQEEIMRGK
jgi:hypothetical protein